MAFRPFSYVRRAAVGVATGGLSEAGGARVGQDLQAREAARQLGHASDTAQAEAAAQAAAAAEVERAAAARAGQAKRDQGRRRGRGSTILASGLGLLAPSPGPATRDLLGG